MTVQLHLQVIHQLFEVRFAFHPWVAVRPNANRIAPILPGRFPNKQLVTVFQVRRKFSDQAAFVPASGSQAVRLDDGIVSTTIGLFAFEQSLQHIRTYPATLEFAHNLELSAQAELERKQPKHPVKKTVDRAKRELRHAIDQAPQRRRKIRLAKRRQLVDAMSQLLGQALGFICRRRSLGQLG